MGAERMPNMLATRQQPNEYWHLVAELVSQLVVVADHVRCGTSSLEQLRRLQTRIATESNQAQVVIIKNYLRRKGVCDEKVNALWFKPRVARTGPCPSCADERASANGVQPADVAV